MAEIIIQRIDKQNSMFVNFNVFLNAKNQGAIFMAMRENSKLRQMLIDEYNEKKEFLPFILYY